MTLLSAGFSCALIREVRMGSLVVSVRVEHSPCSSPVSVLVSNCREMGLTLISYVLACVGTYGMT